MIKEFVAFYWGLYQQFTWEPVYLLATDPDKYHFHRRRFTKKYRQKQRVVRSLWFSMMLTVLAFPSLHFATIVTLFTTFLSFCILDETP
ncbi:hypothetical protein [Pseudomaricurvus sp. HS19]|uniref:hypothetical protein n=1 Tax=Pseudomaricurvus sp. HS19 TaxID=2692626 RepID=UPI00136933D9|nr:hypothetical protein [Pseudomaricurvus sp. HS19]MYM62233.1 hypothetical protein [Pseudomaricurvus sp. HS19]